MQQGLTKENFFNEMLATYPKSMKRFCDWIDEYKKEVGWGNLFGEHETSNYGRIMCSGIAPKFHHLPYAMQQGIWIEFAKDTVNRYFEQPEYSYDGDLEEDIKNVFSETEELIDN